MKKKLSLEEQCLTIEQAKELRRLGVDFSNANLAFANVIELYIGIFKYEIVRNCLELKDDLIPTLTNSEMLEILPKEIGDKSIVLRNYEDEWVIEYKNHLVIPSISEGLLRDALFEMIKYLKSIKLM